ncbi:hypothetical protein SSPO_073010 [Streptomyces antimycoticus]|uniref:Uncharacterized protein n=1 Tax=Streptomyces antimycoticus TaxID=68175 RepID=A0A499URK6_9ACTN|nr:hypothetical protein SSPO_073010 [Streptomyces antimycoticus]
MKAELSAAVATAAVPLGQPEPFTVLTLIWIFSGGASGAEETPWVERAEANSAAAAPPASRTPDMALQFDHLWGRS